MTPELGGEGIDNSPKGPFYNEYGQITDPDIAFELALLEDFEGIKTARKRERFLLERFKDGLAEEQESCVIIMDMLAKKYPSSCKKGLLDDGESVLVIENRWWLYESMDFSPNWLTEEEIKDVKKQADYVRRTDRLIFTERGDLILLGREELVTEKPGMNPLRMRLRGVEKAWNVANPLIQNVEEDLSVNHLSLFKIEDSRKRLGCTTNHLGSLVGINTSLVSSIVKAVRNFPGRDEGKIKVEVDSCPVIYPFVRSRSFFGNSTPEDLEEFYKELYWRERLFKSFERWTNDCIAMSDNPADILNYHEKVTPPVITKQQRGERNDNLKGRIKDLAENVGRYYADIEERKDAEALGQGIEEGKELFVNRFLTHLLETYPHALKEFKTEDGQKVICSDGIYFGDPLVRELFMDTLSDKGNYDSWYKDSILVRTDGIYRVSAWKEEGGKREETPLTEHHIKALVNLVLFDADKLILRDGVSIFISRKKVSITEAKTIIKELMEALDKRNSVLEQIYKFRPEILE
mgnify:CR=1 FL=1